MSLHDDYLNPDRHDPALQGAQMKSEYAYPKEFPGTAIEPEILDTLGGLFFLDSSWHNDACPSFTYQFTDHSELTVYVADADASRRETPWEPRFTVQFRDPKGEYVLDRYFETDSLADLQVYLESLTITDDR